MSTATPSASAPTARWASDMPLITASEATEAAHEYVSEGYSVADWLNDNAIQCECCQSFFSDESDFDGEHCQECASFNRTPEGGQHCHPQYAVLHPRAVDMSGFSADRLTVIGRGGKHPRGGAWWLCQCACGRQKEIRGTALRSGLIRSCGECLRGNHGQSAGSSPDWTLEFKAWRSMRQRCSDRRSPRNWKSYGSRGITICERWSRFENFLEDMGTKPTPKHSLERIDNDLGYFPENCKWATQSEQMRNTRRALKYRKPQAEQVSA